MKIKEEGISILIAMGTSLLVLSLAFATLASISRSVDQASNIQRSTQLYFASESGAEAAFFHHNSRGPGTNFMGTNANQIIDHSSVNATTNWTIQGRSTHVDTLTPDQNALVVDILKEGQTFKIALEWDPDVDPGDEPADGSGANPFNGPATSTDELEIRFFETPADITNATTAVAAFQDRYGFETDAFEPLQQASFDFGNSGDEEILIDWSITRKNSGQGIQTFIPFNNQDCSGYIAGASAGYICEDDLLRAGAEPITINTTWAMDGRVLPGSKESTLDEFWSCFRTGLPGALVGPTETCSDYQLTLRPLLNFNDTGSGNQIPGIPFQIKLNNGNNSPLHFPLNYYNVVSDVTLEDFSQRIEIEVPERTSIGAFDYVIFD